eukprot:Blabericola_migrator_1__7158@NODE_362_length_9426_cov_300_827118_g290_i0_p2_GENE_NODE_362_length_9426_cov_300_827118_g290_i0NODE_362_length_9426_cov_300_827118_g290_i0_p2_ORF_typecomplete_len448_score96_37KAP/PF05804_12/9_2e06KAP/PF05804_12/1_3e02Arm_2/PF04826_13/6_6e06Arm_2/PF04826_13/2_7e03Cnd1/PF12717_7/0_44Cnd1/PF12717_7/21Cnd1/PF12717_7/5_5e02Adaptin_N/PF01602_20/0_04Arm/PF00514_23/5_3Arm/PF00514_23/9_7e02Arm/PF00514_23/5_5e03Arm/PF00514_23/7_4e03Arm/PF00514_23/43DUF908/PF06012_12/1_3DUF908
MSASNEFTMTARPSPRPESRLNKLLLKSKGLRHLKAKRDGNVSFTHVPRQVSSDDAPSPASTASSLGPAGWHTALEVKRVSCSEDDCTPSTKAPRSPVAADRTDGGRFHLGSSVLFTDPGPLLGNRDIRVLDDLFALLQSHDPDVRDRALSTLFHLVQYSTATRDTILEAGGLEVIMMEIQRDGPADAQTARALYHLCMGEPLPPFHLIAKTLPSLQRLLVTSDEEEVLVITAFVLHELAVVDDVMSLNYIVKIVPPPLYSRLCALLKHRSIDVQFRILRLLNKGATADRIHGLASESHFDDLMKMSFPNHLKKCMSLPELQGECVELVQNLMHNHFEALMKHENLIRKYFSLIRARLGEEARALSMLKAAVHQADVDQMAFLDSCGCGEVLEQTRSDLAQMQRDMDSITAQLAAKTELCENPLDDTTNEEGKCVGMSQPSVSPHTP